MTLGLRPILAHTLTAIASAVLLGHPALAQTAEPAKTDGSLERAQKAADSVFHWIKLNADKGANRQTPAPAPAPAPVARKPAAAAPVAAAPKPAATNGSNSAAMASAAAPQVAAAAPEPAVVQAPAPAPAEPEAAPVLLASAAPTPAPAAPLAVAAQAVEPPPPPVEDEAPLQLISKVNPVIPRQLQNQNFRGGFAQVQFQVQPDGKVSQVQVLKASNTRLGAAAIDAVQQWRFAPIPKAREAAVEVSFKAGDD